MSHTKIYLAKISDCFVKSSFNFEKIPVIERESEIEMTYDKYLLSFHYKSDLNRFFRSQNMLEKLKDVLLFLDSGAFSAYTQGSIIDIDEYIDYITDHKETFSIVANLDDIYSAENTWNNQKTMENHDIKALPCFHVGENIKWLRKYLAEYNYIALGGMVPYSTKTNELIDWLDDIFKNYLCNKDLVPKVKVHGFGMTNLRLIKRYPWYSVDSSSWANMSRNGQIYVPRKTGGDYDYKKRPMIVRVSDMPVTKNFEDVVMEKFSSISIFQRMSKAGQQKVMDYLRSVQVPLGNSRYRILPINKGVDFPLNPYNQKIRRVNKKIGKALLETIIEVGAGNCYRVRDHLCSLYYHELEKTLPYPRPFDAWNTTMQPLF